MQEDSEKTSAVGTATADQGKGGFTRKGFILGGAAATGAALLAACGSDATPASPSAAPDATATPVPETATPVPETATSVPETAAPTVSQITMATPGEPPTLFQNLEYQPQAYSIYDGILEFLIKSDASAPEKGPQAQLAVSWQPIGDTQWEFKLREGVRFHNGEAWNAEAAKVNLDTILTIDPPSPVLFRIGPFASAEVQDEFTLIINTTEPWAMAPIGLSEVQFGAPGLLQDIGPQEFAQRPVGTGPYRFVEWNKGQDIVLESNPEYWGAAPTVDRLVFRGIPDPTTRRQALEAGEVDIIEDVTLEDVSGLRDQGFVVTDTPVAQSVLLSPYIIDATTDGHPTADPMVRLAMNHAINRQEIIDTVLGGFATSLGGQVTGPDAFGWNPTLSDYEYDPQRAKDLLSEAGYSGGVDLGTLFIGEPGEFFKQADFSEVVRAQLAEVGIILNPEVVEFSTFLRMALQEYSLKYWHVGGWQYYPVMDSAFALMWYDSDAFLRQGLNEDSGFNEIWRASNQEFDVEKRRALLEQGHALVHETPGPVVLWQHHKIYAHTDRVQGLVATPDERIHWAGVTV